LKILSGRKDALTPKRYQRIRQALQDT